MNLKEFKHIFYGKKMNINGELTKEKANKYFSKEILCEKSKDFRKIPTDKILLILEKTANKISDKNDYYYKKIIKTMPAITNYSKEMIELAMDLFPQMLTVDNLKKRLKSIGNYNSLDYFINDKYNKMDRSVPIGSVLHITAGNIFLGSIDSLITGIITKNINLLKVSSQDFLFPSLFYEALMEIDKDRIIIPYIAITYWSRKNIAIEKTVKNQFDAVLIFGGEEAVVNYKNGLSAKTEIYSFGPKISFGLVCKDLERDEIKNSAKGFAKDIVYWEQRACTSCQNIFIEDSSNVKLFIDSLYNELENLALKFPQNQLELDSKVEIRKEREIEKWRQFNGKCQLLEGRCGFHTVIVNKSNKIISSPLNRTIYINIVHSYKDIFKGNIDKLKYYMSTVGIVCKENLQDKVEKFIDYGVLRFCRSGSMSVNNDESAPHDGVYLCNLLVRHINKEDLKESELALDFASNIKKDDIILSKLNLLLKEAMKAPFYKEFYKNVKLPLKSLEEFKDIPILEKKHIFNNSVDKGNQMITRKNNNSYIFSAGGTTGKMKYVEYSYDEFKESQKVFGKGFKAVGITKEDTVVNYMKVGAFWTAFLAVNKGLEETGCKILPITANQSERETIEYLKKFKPNVIVGLPGNIILLAQEIEKLHANIKIEKIYYGGEHMSMKAKEYIKNILGAKIISSFSYAAVEIGPIGFQCPHCKGSEHHVLEDWCYLESDKNGEAIVTSLNKTLNPIIRYRIGDKIKWIEEPCSCGRTSKKFKLLSRTDDVIRLNVSDIYLNDVQGVLKNVKEVSPFFQIIIKNVDKMRDIIFKIETKSKNVNYNKEMLINKIKLLLKTNIRSIGKDYRNNLINNINVELLPPYAIERVGRTGKIRKIIDRRIY